MNGMAATTTQGCVSESAPTRQTLNLKSCYTFHAVSILKNIVLPTLVRLSEAGASEETNKHRIKQSRREVVTGAKRGKKKVSYTLFICGVHF